MKGSRRHSRELALQGIYQWLINQSTVDDVLAQIGDKDEFSKADQAYLESLVRNVLSDVCELRDKVSPFLDRPIEQLSPIEHALLLMAASELTTQPDVPYRVIINEAVELAKAYGGTDGHKYINGVLDKLASDLRPAETGARKKKSIN